MLLKRAFSSALVYASLVAASLAAIVPLLVIFIASFKTGEEFRSTGPFELPQNWLNFENYAAAITRGNMLLGLANTAILLAVSIIGTILIGTMAAYVLSRFTFRFKGLVLFLFLLASLVPGVTTQVATFQVVSSLGLFNTRWAAILLFMGTDILAIYIFLQFLEGIPVELDEAAIIEGASYFRIYRSVIFPLLYPAIATVVIIKGVAIYNEFYIPFLYMPKTSLGVISTALFRFKGPFIAQWEIISAGIVLAIIPSLVAFLALQKYIYNGLTQGAVKS
jgi:ABC-type glycerol-3-phosphate transport system permease component